VGRLHTIALKANGTLWSWGENQNGSLGVGDTTDRLTPVRVGSQSDWARIAAGYTRSFAINTNGTLWGFGGNTSGSLGTGVGSGRYETPVQIGSSSDWSQVSTSPNGNHSAGIRADGTLWTWGTNASGELGLGTTTDKYVPTQVANLNTWLEIECGWNHTLAIKSDGSLWAWGNNGDGQLGLGDTKGRLSPVQVGIATDWYRVVGGIRHSLAIKTDGTLWAWGDNSKGQLGIPGGGRLTPTRVGTDIGWKAIRATAGSGGKGAGSSAAIR
jgi:alpha-tubulin suppressor-like RCC1 family protein